MAQVQPSNKPVTFEYSALDGIGTLFPAMKIYDLSSGSAVLTATVGMTHVFNGTYWGTFTFTSGMAGKTFLIQKSVYTSGTFVTLNTNYSPGSECVEIDGFDQNFGIAR